MALIKCTECGREISDKADICPNCGCPVEKPVEMTVKKTPDTTATIPSEPKPPAPVKGTRKSGGKKGIIIAVCVIVVLAVSGAGIYFGTANSRKYSAAVKEYDSKKYETAMQKFKSLGDYKDSADMMNKAAYANAMNLYNKEKYEDAKPYFEDLGDYKDAREYVKDCDYQQTVDGQFMRALAKGLMARWDKNDQYIAEGKTTEDPNIYSEMCDIELGNLQSYYEQPFENEQLGQDAKTYIDLLTKAKDATKYYTVDYVAYATQWADVYAQRTIILQKFIDSYGLSVDKAHQKTLDTLMRDASAASDQAQAREDIHNMANGFQLTVSDDEWGRKIYKVHMKNTTQYTFDYFYVQINLLDGNGTIIDTSTSSQIASWQPEQEAELDVYLTTQTDLNGYTVQYTPHYQTGTLYE